MDHHCLMLGICIGGENRTAYLLFLSSLCVGSSYYVSLSFLPPVVSLLHDEQYQLHCRFVG